MTPRRTAVVLAIAVGLALVTPAHAQTPDPGGADGPAVEPMLRVDTPVLSARRLPTLLRAEHAERELTRVAAEVIAPVPDSTCLVINEQGRSLFAHNPELALAPASNQKLPIALAAVEVLGAEHRFVTEVRSSEPLRDGIVDGDLFVVGGGDSLLATEGFVSMLSAPEQRVRSDFSALADALVDAGVREVRGDIVGDDSRYGTSRYVESWPARYRNQDTVGPLGALRVNEGGTGFTQRPEQSASNRQPGDPPLLAADTLRTLLERRGVRVSGQPRTGQAPEDTAVIATHAGPPLSGLLDEILGWSRNAAAETLVMELAVATGGQGTTAEGLAVVDQRLRERGLVVDELIMLDGSGLDEGNRMTCSFLTELLDDLEPASLVAASLSVAGERGTLTERLVGTAAEGRIRAKTGTLNQVLSLAGFADAVDGGELTFAHIINLPPQGAPGVTTELQDRLAEAMVAYPNAPPLEVVGPRPLDPSGT